MMGPAGTRPAAPVRAHPAPRGRPPRTPGRRWHHMALAKAAEAGWAAAQTAIVIVAVIAILGGIVSASITYWFNQRAARRERRATTFAEALATVEDYAEMPYRVRRRRNTSEARYELTD